MSGHAPLLRGPAAFSVAATGLLDARAGLLTSCSSTCARAAQRQSCRSCATTLASRLPRRREGPRWRQAAHLRAQDEIIETRSGYGEGNRKPESYLESFGDWIENNTNDITALRVVTQRPRDLTREDLKELKLKLDRAGYTEIQLRSAWSEARNRDIAAGVIGFIRTKALGSPLVPYDERVDRALNRLLQGDHDWTRVQERWLKRIARQIRENTVVDREALDEQPSRSQGGCRRLDNVFDGQLDDVLGEMHEEIWTDRQAA